MASDMVWMDMLPLFALFGVLFLFVIASYVCLGLWVYKDAKSRGIQPGLWTLVVLLVPNLLGLLLYALIGRKEAKAVCPSCGASGSGKYCSGCGGLMGPKKVQGKKAPAGLLAGFGVSMLLFLVGLVMMIFVATGNLFDIPYFSSDKVVYPHVHSGASTISMANSGKDNWKVEYHSSTNCYHHEIRLEEGLQVTVTSAYEGEGPLLLRQYVDGEQIGVIELNRSGESVTLAGLENLDGKKLQLCLEGDHAKKVKFSCNWVFTNAGK